jgi:DNA modification methylase
MAKKAITKLSDLTPDANNYNKGTEFGGGLIEKSLRKLGAGRSILLDKNGKVIAGNKTLENAVNAGFGDDDIIVVQTTGKQIVAVQRMDLDLDSKMGKEMALADNATAKANIEWDTEALSADWSSDELNDWGIDGDGWTSPSNALNSEAVEDGFEVPDIEAVQTDIVTGDLFEIGGHRLLCGDSTNSEDMANLMGGCIADMVLTDPPYGVSYVGKTKDAMTIENDAMTDVQTFELWEGALAALWPTLKDGGAIYATVPPGRLQLGFMRVMEELGALRQVMVWNKSSMVMGHSDYHYKHEPILYGWKPGAAHYFTPDRTKTIVLDFDRPQRNGEHPTMKPIPLWGELMGNSSRNGEIVIDPFSGSGTTMVAAEQIGRKARCMELDPKYCQVIVNRMLTLNPEIVVKKNGVAYVPKS